MGFLRRKTPAAASKVSSKAKAPPIAKPLAPAKTLVEQRPKPIQEIFGDAILAAVHAFCDADVDSVQDLEAKYFLHVDEAKLRTSLAETMYGARWIYKLGLALLVRDEKQVAHVRVQVIDYGAVCEGLLSAMIHRGLSQSLLAGAKFRVNDTVRLRDPIAWNRGNIDLELPKRSFHWLIEVAAEEQMISAKLAKNLHGLRKERNTIHVRTRTYKAYIGTSKHLFTVLHDTIEETKAWRAAH